MGDITELYWEDYCEFLMKTQSVIYMETLLTRGAKFGFKISYDILQ